MTRSSADDLEWAVAALETSVEPLFAAGRYREFFQRAHQLRERFKAVRLAPDTREGLWERLNRCTEAAKQWQAREFAARNAANLARWREQLATAQRYADALQAEVDELATRRGPPAELDRWQRRIAEKRGRLASVEANLDDLRRKISDVSSRKDAKAQSGNG